ncbi:PREDICTED: protein chibby homolog 1 [Pygoscelis adeliae]|nr:PREDICTED: protein chibby homolog 1 [Pygoscelis adeliae]
MTCNEPESLNNKGKCLPVFSGLLVILKEAGEGRQNEKHSSVPKWRERRNGERTRKRKEYLAPFSHLHSLDRSTREIELGLEYGIPTMNLAGQSLKFENGQWVAESGSFTGDRREMQRLRKRNQQLEEENNLLRLKVDILLDMLSETTAESHLMEKELEELKNHSRRRK